MKLPRRWPAFNSSLIASIGGVIVVVYLGVMLGQTIKRNYDLDRQISDLQQQIDTLQQQKNQLSFNLQYYQTDSFAEREARAKLGLQKPGEGVIIIPQRNAPSATSAVPAAKPHESNFRQWLDFLLGRAN